ncbi:hypothetical protein [Rhodoblastus sp.]|jgi:hypothetical protein|uniref:hypothetical protein n=1 Tax=Rhodoblastus sp. TaxID=1962975 RepID=UPI0025CF433F|nr:hypothetical protein [Rhodoblastus sp.]
MSKRKTKHPDKPHITKCIFCGGVPLSETHIWPNWLRKVIPKQNNHFELLNKAVPIGPARTDYSESLQKYKRDLFSKDPLLACGACNGGWMKDIEDKVVYFLKQALKGELKRQLSRSEQAALAAWIALITILAEYEGNKIPTIYHNILSHIRQYATPTDNFNIFIG